jgi:hypothetical protein
MHRSLCSIVAAGLTAGALGACVTINIYFPAAAAERAADRIIDEVLGPEGLKPGTAKPAAKPAAPREDEAK